jgi:hypothetical protein
MGYAELIETLQSLPQDKRAEVFDFVEFLVAKSKMASTTQHEPNGHGIALTDNEHVRSPLLNPLPLAGEGANESLCELHNNEWTDGEFAQFAMRQALRGMEDEAVSYTRDDIKERWQ